MNDERRKMKDEKALWRKRMKEKRRELGMWERVEKGRKIIEIYQNLEEFKRADIILIYCSVGEEIDTSPLITACFHKEKRVAVPKVIGSRENAAMDFYFLEENTPLQKGPYGIQEPVGGNLFLPSEWDGKQVEMILPGLCFDLYGSRIGYGGGYYDRYLSRFQAFPIHKTALAFACQVADKPLPCEQSDIKVQMLVTEESVSVLSD